MIAADTLSLFKIAAPIAVFVALLSIEAMAIEPNLRESIDRPLRYQPIDRGFLIENGPESFNRPLYGGNTAFRVDAGDKPEFSLYLPGRGGVVRLGVRRGNDAKWLVDARSITTRYLEGAMHYEIRDPLLGECVLRLVAVAAHDAMAALLRLDVQGDPSGIELITAYGGANGDRGRRSGDIGTEAQPVSQFFQLKPQHCAGNSYQIEGRTFVMIAGNNQVAGVLPAGSAPKLADANKWSSAADLVQSSAGDAPVIVAVSPLTSGTTLSFERITENTDALNVDKLDAVFERSVDTARRISRQVVVETPDPFVNSAVAALCTAADGVWDEPGSAFMHGAVAWRNKLLGWRGVYTGDALGWHGRTRRHLENWTVNQVATEVDPSIQGADPDQALARSERMLHSNGAMTKSHYDMNLVAIDAMFRHFLWTGDVEYMRKCWPVIVRHLAWERRLFRREFGPDKLPLYEAYACIWASDDLQYHGGGATHSTAYNLWHNQMAARVADVLGEDSSPYRTEAELIKLAMRQYLWLPDGWYAEFKDLLGKQLVHPSAGVWTYYHAIDSHAADPFQAWQMGRYIETQLPHIPIKGPGVPSENLSVLASTNWMPYTWSINNVVMAENVHTALADWQAQRPQQAFATFKGSLLNSMFMGLCPGNVGMATQFDVYRRESQRDFADGVGSTSRALIEGLFGILPDAIDRTLTIRPGFPGEWSKASIQHPDLSYGFVREGAVETFTVEQTFATPMKLSLRVPARSGAVESVTVNGEPADWQNAANAIGRPVIVIDAPAEQRHVVRITYAGGIVAAPQATHERIDFPAARVAFERVSQGQLTWWVPVTSETPAPTPATTRPSLAGAKFESVDLSAMFNDRVTRIFKNEYRSPRSPYCSLAIPITGLGAWASNKATAEIDDAGLRGLAKKNQPLKLPNGVTFAMTDSEKNVAFCSQWDHYPRHVQTPLAGRASHVYLLMAGSTNPMQSRFENGAVIVEYADSSTAKLSLRNPETWWPIEQDYFIDDYQFRYDAPLPIRVDLKTARVRVLDPVKFKGQGRKLAGGAATVLDLALDPSKELKSLRVEATANEVVIGLLGATLARP